MGSPTMRSSILVVLTRDQSERNRIESLRVGGALLTILALREGCCRACDDLWQRILLRHRDIDIVALALGQRRLTSDPRSAGRLRDEYTYRH
ncbi:unnamed protein product [Lasius platythorax]|uniref:Uncharacterized protein n=1 Tax=Lasius platythorax TaxID=488582 RepID=A0AAV2P643_9HYME